MDVLTEPINLVFSLYEHRNQRREQFLLCNIKWLAQEIFMLISVKQYSILNELPSAILEML